MLAIPASCAGVASLFIAGSNLTYADRYYADKADVEQILASRAWHPVFGGRWRDCSYAIARITEMNAIEIALEGPIATTPPVRHRGGARNWPALSNWQSTPSSVDYPGTDDAFLDCKDRLPTAVFAEMQDILSRPDAYAIRSWQKVYLIAPNDRLIAYVRYGD